MSTVSATPRYLSTYRQDELRLIFAAAKEGRSLCFLGVAGVGKSNLVNFLRYDEYHYKPHYLQGETTQLLFPTIDGNAWSGKPQRLWELMLDALAQVTTEAPPAADPKIIQLPGQISEEQQLFSMLRTRVQALTTNTNCRIMFILDDFDKVLQNGPVDLLEQLSTLRSAGNRNRLSYLIFVKKMPRNLGHAAGLDENSQFYSLFKRDIYVLEPHDHDDTRQLLLFLNELSNQPLKTRPLILIGERLSGGHAGLAKVLHTRWSHQPPPNDEDTVSFFAQQAEVRDECRRIFDQLHPEEQDAALAFARGQHVAAEWLEHLARRGLLIHNSNYQWRSPILGEYLRTTTARNKA